MPSLERASSARRVGPWSLVGLVLVPLIVAAGFLWATWDSTDRLDRVQAAVVNLDEPVELDGQTVPLGRQLTVRAVTEKRTRVLRRCSKGSNSSTASNLVVHRNCTGASQDPKNRMHSASEPVRCSIPSGSV